MQVEFLVKNKAYKIELIPQGDLPFRIFDFYYKDDSDAWIKTEAGKQWSASLQEQKGGMIEYIRFLFDSINSWLESNTEDFEPTDDAESLLAYIRDNMKVVNGKLTIN